MNASVEPAAVESSPRYAPVTLRGTARGLEIVVHPEAAVDEIADLLEEKLAKSPGFFAGSDVFVQCETALPMGALTRLEQIAVSMDLRIVEIGPAPVVRKRRKTNKGRAKTAPVAAAVDEAPTQPMAATPTQGSAPEPAAAPEPEPVTPEPAAALPEPAAAPMPAPPALDDTLAALEAESLLDRPRLIVGPVRSGTILEATGHMIVLGDVNPGAELRACGSIIVLGALRGIAHAGVEGQEAFIFALKLGPQQLRIGHLITRAGESDDEIGAPEIAYAAGNQIIVEHYRNKLPGGLSAAAL